MVIPQNFCMFSVLIAKLILSGAAKLVVLFDSNDESSTNILHVVRRSVGKHILHNDHDTDDNFPDGLVKKGTTFLTHIFISVDICDLVSEGTTAILAVSNNDSVRKDLELATESFSLPVLMTEKPCGVSRDVRFTTVSQQLQQAIFEYLKNELLAEVFMFHEEYDGEHLSKLLMSFGARIHHITVAENSRSLKVLKHLISSWSTSTPTNGKRVFISLIDETKANQQLEFMMSSIKGNAQTKFIVVGNLQKWQKILLEVKAYEMDFVVFSRYSGINVGYPFAVEISFNASLPWKDSECKVLPRKQQEIGKTILRDIQEDLTDNHCFHALDEYIIWKSFLANDGLQSLLPVALWGNDTGLLPIRPARLEMLTLRIVLKETSSFISLCQSRTREVVLCDCPLKEILEFLKQKLHFRYELKMQMRMELGKKLDNNWTGAIGQLIRGEADIIPFIPTVPARHVIEYTKPIVYTSQQMLVAYPSEPTRAFMYIQFYQKQVWILLFLTMLAVTYSLTKLHECTESPISFPSCFWLMFGALLHQGSTHLPRTSACRIVLAAWWLLVIVITTTYSANLVSFLVSNQSKYVVKSLEELANHETIILAINEESPLLEDFMVSKNKLYERIRNVYLTNPRRFRIYTHKSWDLKILTDVAAGKAVMIDDASTLKLLMRAHFHREKRCNFTLIPLQIGNVALAFGLRKRSPFLQPFNDGIQKFTESGQSKAWEKFDIFFAHLDKCSEILGSASGKRPVKMDDLYGPFCLMLLGTLLGLLLLGGEAIYHKWTRNSTFQIQKFCCIK